MKNYSSVSIIGVVAALAVACGGGSAPATDGSATSAPAPAVITVDGSSTVFPVTEAVAEEFQKLNTGTQVTVGRSGTGGGFQKFCRNETVISNASRPIAAAEIEACKKGGIDYIELPIAYDGMAVVVNPKNTWATSMTVAELKKLWYAGRTRKGSAMEPGACRAGRIRKFTCSAPASIPGRSTTSPR